MTNCRKTLFFIANTCDTGLWSDDLDDCHLREIWKIVFATRPRTGIHWKVICWCFLSIERINQVHCTEWMEYSCSTQWQNSIFDILYYINIIGVWFDGDGGEWKTDGKKKHTHRRPLQKNNHKNSIFHGILLSVHFNRSSSFMRRFCLIVPSSNHHFFLMQFWPFFSSSNWKHMDIIGRGRKWTNASQWAAAAIRTCKNCLKGFRNKKNIIRLLKEDLKIAHFFRCCFFTFQTNEFL